MEESTIHVSEQIIVDLNGEQAEAGRELLGQRFPRWEWTPEATAEPLHRLVGPRLRSADAERLRSEVERLLVPVGATRTALRPVEAPSLWHADTETEQRPPRPLGGGGYVPPTDPDARLVLGVTTLGRREYLQHFLESFNATRSDRYHWTVVIADDGSLDETLEWLRDEAVVDADLVIVENTVSYTHLTLPTKA